jgi:protein SCO1
MSVAQKIERAARRTSGSPLFWLGFVGLLFAYPIGSSLMRKVPAAPPVMVPLPAFELTDHLGNTFGSKELADHVWIANFIFTSCPTRCPELTDTMKKVQKRMRNMGDSVFLVSISVDPENDSVQKLAEYAKKNQVNYRRWRFLTGDLTAVKEAVEKGFKMPMDKGNPQDGQTLIDITHGTRFVLVDQKNRVRGLYETDDASINQLVQDLAVIVNVPEEPIAQNN